jgi:hypothetical protein
VNMIFQFDFDFSLGITRVMNVSWISIYLY